MPSPYIVRRSAEIDWIIETLRGSHCISVVGLSNMGKSLLIRSLSQPDVTERYRGSTGNNAAFVYVDCNSMLELSGQGFYELTLRSIMESIDLEPQLRTQLEDEYHRIIEPDTQFLVPLGFNNAMNALIEHDQFDLILLFDEFDEAFDALDGRVFLNLRALKDRYPQNLTYITASVRRLGSKRFDEQIAEFIELSARHTLILKPLTRSEADELAVALAQYASLDQKLTPPVLDFLWDKAGGHPGMLMASINHIFDMPHLVTGIERLGVLEEELHHDLTILTECKRIWSQLGPDERQVMLQVAISTEHDAEIGRTLRSLQEWGLVREDVDTGEAHVFNELLTNFVRRQATVQKGIPDGVWVDEDSGDVWIDGKPAPPLTELEFKLLSLLHERIDKLTDKYQIVERVWGVEYIDEVDDARIEKLVSRLRAKIEPDGGEQGYVVTVRGRGYKLVAP